ncbi:MAG: nitrite/sulfite reductase [Eubacterium sp.]|nr:nitrite/sulfite reductase [Eubacterium sp.]
MDVEIWKQYLPEFKEKTAQFYEGNLTKGDYKAFSGFYGSYAQRSGQKNMLRLRMPAGRVTKEKLAFTAAMLRKYKVPRMHFTTCQTIQLHDLNPNAVYGIMEEALDAGIVIIGGGGDYPRNVMCPPLTGVQQEEFFDVLPWAQAAGDYLLTLIPQKKMPRKLKVGFSSSPANVTHATYRDLGFVATRNGSFDVYSAGGLGTNPRFGVKVAQDIAPDMILYYIKAMWLTFLAYGNYESRVKARTRYMQEALGGPEQYAAAFQEKLKEALNSNENLKIQPFIEKIIKKGDGTSISDPRVIQQKQDGLYTVCWHPIGGVPKTDIFCAVSDAVNNMDAVEMRLAPDETAYLINLTAKEAHKMLELTADSAQSAFETSVSCIGASVCQVGVRDSQALLTECVQAVRDAAIPDGALPQIHISGCPSSCGTHQTGILGFRGGIKKVEGKPQPAFMLYVNGCEQQGKEAMGREIGAILETDIPKFLVKLGHTVAQSGLSFADWKKGNENAFEQIAAEYI